MTHKITEVIDDKQLPLVVIVGPTASGKSALAMEIASKYNGEIICADSRTVYKHLDVGVTKPSLEDQRQVPHWGLDLVEPGERYSAADFKQYALKKIEEIRQRGHLPMLVGGTGLYVDGVIFDYEFGQPQPELREKLELLSTEELYEYCRNNNIELPENEKNRRYIIRAIEQKSINNKRRAMPIVNTIVVGIATNRDILRSRIEARAEQLFESGMVEEAKMLGKKYGWNSEAMTGNIYQLVRKFEAGELNAISLKQASVTADWKLAKRQLTWLRRNPFIHWIELPKAAAFIEKQLP